MGKFVSAISIPKGNPLPLTFDIAQNGDVVDYKGTNYHGRYYIVKVRRTPGPLGDVRMAVRMSVGSVQRTLSPTGGYTLAPQPTPLPNPIVDVMVHFDQVNGETFNNVGGETQPEFFEINTHDETANVNGQSVRTGYQLAYYKVLVSIHGAQTSPIIWDEYLGEEPPGYFCDYSFKISAWHPGDPLSSPFKPDVSDSERPFGEPSLVQARQVALWPMPRFVWTNLKRRGTRVPMGGDYWVSKSTWQRLNIESRLLPGNRKPWLQALLEAVGTPANPVTSTSGIINDVTYEHGGGHTGEHFSGNEIDMPPPGLAFKQANGSADWDAIGQFLFNLLNDPDVGHFIYQDTEDARTAFFSNLPASWQKQIKDAFGESGWKSKWLVHYKHTDHIHLSFKVDPKFNVGL